MTCIVGLKQNGHVYIGGDSVGVAGYMKSARRDEKVFRNKNFIMGFTSSFRMGQLIRYSFDPPKQTKKSKKNSNDMKYMVTTFVDSLRDTLKKGGYAKKLHDVETTGHFLVGYRGEIYHIESDYQVGIEYDNWCATGAGEEVALGSLYSTHETGMSPVERISTAMASATHHTNVVMPPYVIVGDDGTEECINP